MHVSFQTVSELTGADMLIGLVREGAAPRWLKEFGLESVPGLDDVRGTKDELTLLHTGAAAKISRLCLVGLGTLDAVTEEEQAHMLSRFRSALASAILKARSLQLKRVALAMPSLIELDFFADKPARLAHEAVYAMQLALYRFLACKNDEDVTPNPEALILVCDTHGEGCTSVAQKAAAEAEAVCFARDLVNTPANLLPPMAIADIAVDVCASLPVQCTVLGLAQLKEEGLNTLLAVSQGSAKEPVLVCLDYAPQGHEQDDPLIFIGKGLSFDSGGLSLKPSASMHEMKSDMGGAAAVLAAMTLIARLGAPRRVIGLLACAENMPDALAMRPGDVVRTMKGTTVEVINTDAEGRLVLCDALTYAQKHWKPTRIVDIATLTGACMVALGTETAGLFATDDSLAAEIAAEGLVRGERFWRLPVWDIYAENLKSPTADLANVGPREGGAISAALFLKHFIENDTPWAHLDIAGTAYKGKGQPGNTGGATGFGVRTLAALAGV